MSHPSFSSLPPQHILPTTPKPAHLSKITKTGSLPVPLPEGVPPKKSIQYQFDNNVPMLKEAARPSVELDGYVADSCVLKDGWGQQLHGSYSSKEINNTHVKAMETIQPEHMRGKREDYVEELAA